MGTITANITNETEKYFRETVKKELGKGKGILGKAIDEALKKWAEEKEQKLIAERAITRLKKGYNLGGKWKYQNRAELYDERCRWPPRH